MRKKLFSIIEPGSKDNFLSVAYDFVMIATIIISLVPLAFKETNIIFHLIDSITVNFFIPTVTKITTFNKPIFPKP